MPSTSVMPPGYTFLHVGHLISIKGKKIADQLLVQAENRNPDAFDMYIYNDYFAYGVLDLVDTTLSTVHTKIMKKDWAEAYYVLEALVAFAEFESVWTQCDDGERVECTFKTIGASCVTVLRALKAANQLDATCFPSLEGFLKSVVDFTETIGEDFDCPEYGYLSRAIARRLFKDKSEADFKLEMDRLNEWVAGLEEGEEKDVFGEAVKELAAKRATEASKGKQVKHWFSEGEVCDEDVKNTDFTLSRIWKEYKSHTKDISGRNEWDLTKWSEAERKACSFDAMDDDDY